MQSRIFYTQINAKEVHLFIKTLKGRKKQEIIIIMIIKSSYSHNSNNAFNAP